MNGYGLRSGRSALTWFLILSLAAPVAAQELETGETTEAAAEEKRKQEAKDHFQKGLELAQSEDWDAALAEFRASIDAFPTRVALKNAALSLRNLKRYPDAIKMYAELLRLFEKDMPAEERKNIEESMAQLRGFVGEIDVESNQKDSIVIIDGNQAGTTPLPQPIQVNAGTHSVRVSREGYETFETQVVVAGKQKKLVRVTLKALSSVGTLVVLESGEQSLDVVVDGAVVGKTPWRGTVAVGTHTVFLRGAEDIGTSPSAAEVLQNKTTTLALQATKLDAQIRIEPTPSNARVDLDGVTIGNGVWEGRIKSGNHRIEVAVPGHVPYRKEVMVREGGNQIFPIVLERDLSDPMWQAGFVPHLFIEVLGGIAWSPSFGGGADEACSGNAMASDGSSVSGCADRGSPFGFIVGLRGGYQLTRGLGVELMLGYMKMGESIKRRVNADLDRGMPPQFYSDDYTDETDWSGPLAAAGASYQFLEKTPLTLRVSVGAARAQVETSNGGTFTGTADTGDVSIFAAVPEKSSNAWMPFVAPEVRFGYRFSKNLSADLGVGVFLMFPPGLPRTGTGSPEGTRKPTVQVEPGQFGALTLPSEDTFGTFIAMVPTLAARYDF